MTETPTAPVQPEAPADTSVLTAPEGEPRPTDVVQIRHGERTAFVTRQQAEVVYVPLGWTIDDTPADAPAPGTAATGTTIPAGDPTPPQKGTAPHLGTSGRTGGNGDDTATS